MYIKSFLLSFLTFIICISASAQELKCNVQINTSQIQGTNKQVFTTLQKDLGELMNNRKWSNATFSVSERIECTFAITVKTYAGGDNFTAEIQVQARRPVYNSTYFTTLFNFRDQNFNFTYIEGKPLESNDRQISNNLIATLFFYGYIILGYDADSFSQLGGTPFFHRAEDIANAMQSATETGWKAFESERNRYALINGILDEKLKNLREMYYDYHRLGLDIMSENTDNGRAKIASTLLALRTANSDRPANIAITSFLDTKVDEIADIFSQGQPKEKTQIYELLMDVAPTMQKRFEKIQNGK